MAYDRPPENPIVYTHKDFGSAFFDQNLPNSNERMFMICRAINYDLGNYNKLYSTPDYAQRRRYLKNAGRFLDNPIAYVLWKSGPYWLSGKLRVLPVWWALTYVSTWWFAGKTFAKAAKEVAIDKVYMGHQATEVSVEAFSYSRLLTLFFHESEGNASKGLISSKNYPPLPQFCRLNYHVRDQNLRKYFAHRERRGADPFTGKPISS